MKNVQKRVFNLVRDDERNSWSGTIFNSVIIVFIVINVVFVILDTFDMPAGYLAVSRVIEFVAVVILPSFTFYGFGLRRCFTRKKSRGGHGCGTPSLSWR